jgi:ribonuclease P protein component
VFSAGQRCSAPALRLIIARNEAGIPRLGLAVSRKVGGAVVRNRVKRRLREIFRRDRGLLPEPLDIVVVPQAGADLLTFAELREQFLRAVGQWRPKGARR